ncbi:MAG TPA: 4-aminobutyrate--2-oxoglutarate transaminase [Burkholderiales bacterium]|jgi:4-aminobutyrate aminotransferase/(S)-3-amino-2-methylpropionate transaminase|nr:4-aminobutyrate--2-oxoglutarate transaminase [Burkholderiales bacterium]
MTRTNEHWVERRQAAVARGVASAHPIYVERAENAELWDVEGRRYLDFAGGIAVVNTGHRHPKVMAAVDAQLKRFTHTAFQVVPYESYVLLAEKLNALAPIRGPVKSILFSTGAEAVENAIKIARAATGRPAVIAFSGAFHGRTLFATGMTGKTVPYKSGFGPFGGEIYHAPFPIPYHGVTVDDAIGGIERLFKTDIEPSRVAAIVVEPVQGEGGYYIAPFDFLKRLRTLCDQHGIVFVADEVQSGFARTGKFFAIEHAGVEPDLITIAKSLAGGFVLSGVVGRAGIMDAPGPGGLGGTYAGHPVGCAAALAVIEVILEEKLNERSLAIGARIDTRLKAMKARPDSAPIGDVRHLGAMAAFELIKTRGGNEPDADAAKALTARALAHGLILLTCGVFGNAIRIMVPVTVSDAVLDEGLDIIERSLLEIADTRSLALPPLAAAR